MDIYTGWPGEGGNDGLVGAAVELVKEDGVVFVTNRITDAFGETWFQDLPVGRCDHP